MKNTDARSVRLHLFCSYTQLDRISFPFPMLVNIKLGYLHDGGDNA